MKKEIQETLNESHFSCFAFMPDTQTRVSFLMLLEIKGHNDKRVSDGLDFAPGFSHPHGGNRTKRTEDTAGVIQMDQLFG